MAGFLTGLDHVRCGGIRLQQSLVQRGGKALPVLKRAGGKTGYIESDIDFLGRARVGEKGNRKRSSAENPIDIAHHFSVPFQPNDRIGVISNTEK